jgi:hypothetical protein
MGFFVILPIPFEILDAAIAEKLTYFINGFVDFSRTPITPFSTVYQLRQYQLKEVGEIRIRKLLVQESELYVKYPDKFRTLKRREITQEEKEYINSKSDKSERTNAYLEIIRKIDQENDELYARRIKHLNDIADGLLQRLKADPFTWPPEQSRDVLTINNCIDDFIKHTQSQMRMYFWRSQNGKHKWITNPETEAKKMLLNFLAARIGNSALLLEEIKSGAGRIDIFIAFSNEERAVVELKMCGNGYSLNYAQSGLVQVHHYMENKNAKTGYLIVFDSRTRDFGKDIPNDETEEGKRIIAKVIDVRPNVK